MDEPAGVGCAALSALQDKLAKPDACMNRQWPTSDVRQFQDLAIAHSGRNETRRYVNHQPEPGEAATAL